jgi:hypothetical protein
MAEHSNNSKKVFFLFLLLAALVTPIYPHGPDLSVFLCYILSFFIIPSFGISMAMKNKVLDLRFEKTESSRCKEIIGAGWMSVVNEKTAAIILVSVIESCILAALFFTFLPANQTYSFEEFSRKIIPALLVYFAAAAPLNALLFKYKRQSLKDFLKDFQRRESNKKYLLMLSVTLPVSVLILVIVSAGLLYIFALIIRL